MTTDAGGTSASNLPVGPLVADGLRQKAFVILSRLQSGTENVVRLDDALSAIVAGRDCRLCAHFTTKSGGCVSVVQCVDSKQFKATVPRQYWIPGPNVLANLEPTVRHL